MLVPFSFSLYHFFLGKLCFFQCYVPIIHTYIIRIIRRDRHTHTGSLPHWVSLTEYFIFPALQHWQTNTRELQACHINCSVRYSRYLLLLTVLFQPEVQLSNYHLHLLHPMFQARVSFSGSFNHIFRLLQPSVWLTLGLLAYQSPMRGFLGIRCTAGVWVGGHNWCRVVRV